MAKLIIMEGPQKGTPLMLPTGSSTLGRAPDNSIHIDDGATVSGHHCMIELDADGTCVVRDNNSTNGTFVNGESVKSTQLFRGDILQLGNFQLMIDGEDVLEADGAARSEGIAAAAAPAAQSFAPSTTPVDPALIPGFAKHRDTNKFWKIAIIVIAVAALAAAAWFVKVLLNV